MDEKTFPNWMLAAVVIGLGQLTYYVWTRYGFEWGAKSALAVTVLAAVCCLIIYVGRLRRRKKDGQQSKAQV